MSKTGKSSNIILLCINLPSKKTSIEDQNPQTLHQIFSPFGLIKKIMIFCKRILFKAFIEFSSIESAIFAHEICHKSKFFDLGSISIYFSNLKKLELTNGFIESFNFETKADYENDLFLAKLNQTIKHRILSLFNRDS